MMQTRTGRCSSPQLPYPASAPQANPPPQWYPPQCPPPPFSAYPSTPVSPRAASPGDPAGSPGYTGQVTGPAQMGSVAGLQGDVPSGRTSSSARSSPHGHSPGGGGARPSALLEGTAWYTAESPVAPRSLSPLPAMTRSGSLGHAAGMRMVSGHRAMMGAQGWGPRGPRVYQGPGYYGSGVPLEYPSGGTGSPSGMAPAMPGLQQGHGRNTSMGSSKSMSHSSGNSPGGAVYPGQLGQEEGVLRRSHTTTRVGPASGAHRSVSPLPAGANRPSTATTPEVVDNSTVAGKGAAYPRAGARPSGVEDSINATTDGITSEDEDEDEDDAVSPVCVPVAATLPGVGAPGTPPRIPPSAPAGPWHAAPQLGRGVL